MQPRRGLAAGVRRATSILVMLAAGGWLAAEPGPGDAAVAPSAPAPSQRILDPARDVDANGSTATAAAQRIEANRSYLIPALDILGFQFLLNRYDNAFEGDEYHVTLDSIRRNL